MNLETALKDPVWVNHRIGKVYLMDGEPGWKIAYYPIFEDGKTGEVYKEPKALVERPGQWIQNDKIVYGIDFREVPLHYLKES